jgi:sarcosine oxidase
MNGPGESADAPTRGQRASTVDVVVIGLGAMGSAALWQLARRGARVVGVDRFTPPHAEGSTHGRTRIIREAYYEHPLYVPLVRRAYAMWDALARESGERLFLATGGLMLGPESGTLVGGALRSAREHGLAYELVDAREVARRFPAIAPPPGDAGVIEPRAGLLFPELGVRAMLAAARAAGAEARPGARVHAWSATPHGVRVATDAGEITARHAIFAAGAWMPALVPELAASLSVMRQMGHWFAPRARSELFRADRMPILLWEHTRDRFFYSLPDVGEGFKASIHHEGRVIDPDAPRDAVTDAETDQVRALLERLMPDASGRLLDRNTCLYTNTPDGHFAIGAHPAHSNVSLVSACSGHGFKFAPAIGELLAQLVLDGGPAFDLAPFALARLWRPAAPHTAPVATP